MKHFTTLIRELLTIFYTFHFFAGLGYLEERYYISVPSCPDSRLGNGVPPTKYLGERRYPAFPPLHHVM